MTANYNLAAAEATMRANIALAMVERRAMAADHPEEIAFLNAQSEFDEARIQFTLAGMRAENAGLGRNETLSAAGYAIGSMWASGLQFAVGARERAVLNGWLQQALVAYMGQQAATKTVDSVLPTVGEVGHG